MDNRELSSKLAAYQKQLEPRWRGQRQMLKYLEWWFANQDVPVGEFSTIEQTLPERLVEAMEFFRSSELSVVKDLRAEYLEDVHETEFPVMTDVSGGLSRRLMVTELAREMAKVLKSKWLEAKIEAYFTAEDTLLDLTLHRFNRQVWRNGMWEIVKKSTKSGHSGKFGNTELGTFCTAGRVMITFAKEDLNSMNSVSFVADDSDPTGLRTGLQSIYIPLLEAIPVITDVIVNWPATAEARQKAFKPNPKISIL